MFSVVLTVDKTVTESQCIDGAKCLSTDWAIIEAIKIKQCCQVIITTLHYSLLGVSRIKTKLLLITSFTLYATLTYLAWNTK